MTEPWDSTVLEVLFLCVAFTGWALYDTNLRILFSSFLAWIFAPEGEGRQMALEPSSSSPRQYQSNKVTIAMPVCPRSKVWYDIFRKSHKLHAVVHKEK